MTGIFDYLAWRGDISMDVCPFNEIDGVILARFSYWPLEAAFDFNTGIHFTIDEIVEKLLSVRNIDRLVRLADDIKLMEALRDSVRFNKIEIFDYVNRLSEEVQLQFSAITARLSDGRLYIAFRGTDNTIIGWKEDFNMCFVCPIQAQVLAAEYLERSGCKSSGSIMVGGHSKGGNLAVYAATFCSRNVQDRITSVYNFDGPGFDEKVLRTEGYRRICSRVQTFVPQSSIVGMLLSHEEEYTIVHSAQKNGLWQHDIYSWEVKRNHFICLETVNNSSKFIDFTLKAWIAEMDYAKREKLIDTVYAVLNKTQVNTIRELNESKFSNAMIIMKSIKDLDEPTKRAVIQSIKSLVRAAKQEALIAIKSR